MRVDIFYQPWSIRGKAIADLIGVVVFLLPFVIVVGTYGWPFVARSWRLSGRLGQFGGMPGLFVLKSFILVFCVLVGLQGLAWPAAPSWSCAGKEEPAARKAALPARGGLRR